MHDFADLKRVVSSLLAPNPRHYQTDTPVRAIVSDKHPTRVTKSVVDACAHYAWAVPIPVRSPAVGYVPRVGWDGLTGCMQRSDAVRAQFNAHVNSDVRPAQGQYTLTKLALAALARDGLVPLCAGGLLSAAHVQHSAVVDCVAYDTEVKLLCTVQLKYGAPDDRWLLEDVMGNPVRMCPEARPLQKVPDTRLNRDMLEAACVHHQFASMWNAIDDSLGGYTLTQANMAGSGRGKHDVPCGGARVLYVNDECTFMYNVSQWWQHRVPHVLAWFERQEERAAYDVNPARLAPSYTEIPHTQHAPVDGLVTFDDVIAWLKHKLTKCGLLTRKQTLVVIDRARASLEPIATKMKRAHFLSGRPEHDEIENETLFLDASFDPARREWAQNNPYTKFGRKVALLTVLRPALRVWESRTVKKTHACLAPTASAPNGTMTGVAAKRSRDEFDSGEMGW